LNLFETPCVLRPLRRTFVERCGNLPPTLSGMAVRGVIVLSIDYLAPPMRSAGLLPIRGLRR
jgi:hypothetical protein